MRFAEDIIIRPFITEKSNDDLAEGKYTLLWSTCHKNSHQKRCRKALQCQGTQCEYHKLRR